MQEVNILILDTGPEREETVRIKEVLDSCPYFRTSFHEEFSSAGNSDHCHHDLHKKITDSGADVVLLMLPSHDIERSSSFLQSVSRETTSLPIIVVIDSIRDKEMILLLKLGASDFITSPFKSYDIVPRIWRLSTIKNRYTTLTQRLKSQLGLKRLVGTSPVFLEEVEKIPVIAKCDANVLITGETGTGKELFARSIHYLSRRANNSFIPVNCGAIPPELIENEMFGHVRGAFTNAFSSEKGLIYEADNGTLLLDEVDCLPLSVQAKLLRFLQEKEFRQIGSTKMQKANVRVIAISNVDLEQSVEEGKFRKDLFYRLNVIPVKVPALRARKEDIQMLSYHFMEKYSAEHNKPIEKFSNAAIQKLIMYDWPGNVRELENIVERAVVFSTQSIIQGADIVLPRSGTTDEMESFQTAKNRVVTDFEKQYINNILLENMGNITKAAKVAHKNRRAFFALIKKHKIDVDVFKPNRSRV
jgi:DNA-binding NtrC family response regulator